MTRQKPPFSIAERLFVAVMRYFRVQCGAFGGSPGNVVENNRWCLKEFGHWDSCAYDVARQPLDEIRRRARGWNA